MWTKDVNTLQQRDISEHTSTKRNVDDKSCRNTQRHIFLQVKTMRYYYLPTTTNYLLE